MGRLIAKLYRMYFTGLCTKKYHINHNHNIYLLYTFGTFEASCCTFVCHIYAIIKVVTIKSSYKYSCNVNAYFSF